MLVFPAAVVCTYTTGYSEPDISGPCFVDAVAGCPVHLVQPHSLPPVMLNPLVFRDAQSVPVTSMTSVVGMTSATFTDVDYFSCDCTPFTATTDFDEISLTLTGANAGDTVAIDGVEITIEPASTCQPPQWPELDVHHGACDHCPVPTPENHGCATSTGPGLGLALLALLALRRRR